MSSGWRVVVSFLGVVRNFHRRQPDAMQVPMIALGVAVAGTRVRPHRPGEPEAGCSDPSCVREAALGTIRPTEERTGIWSVAPPPTRPTAPPPTRACGGKLVCGRTSPTWQKQILRHLPVGQARTEDRRWPGATGAGKDARRRSTNLISRFYDIADGDPLRRHQHRGHKPVTVALGVVAQDVKLFTGTVWKTSFTAAWTPRTRCIAAAEAGQRGLLHPTC